MMGEYMYVSHWSACTLRPSLRGSVLHTCNVFAFYFRLLHEHASTMTFMYLVHTCIRTLGFGVNVGITS